MKSIQSRLVSGLLFSLILVFLVLWLIVSHNIQNLSEQYIRTRIEHDIENLITAISFNKDNSIQVNGKYINPIYKRPFSGHYYLIKQNQTIVRSRSLWDQNLTIPAVSANTYIESHQIGPQNQPLILLSRRFNKQNKQFSITIAEDLTPVTTAIETFTNYFSFISVIILTCLVLIQIIVLRSGLHPLRKIHSELGQLESGDITSLSSDVPDELQSVVKQINQLSQAHHKRLKRSRDALSDLSHAIKKPLTVLQQLSESQTDLNSESKHTLSTQIESIQNITDHILKRARVAGSIKQGELYCINNDLELLIKTIRKMYPDKHIEIQTQLTDNLQIKVDREDMLELLGNLLDNAWKWTATKILITAYQNKCLHITIEDDGNSENVDALNELISRGTRLDETVSGYGFGLAISSDIVKDYNGTLNFSPSEILGGFKSEIIIPMNEHE